jgi:predicted DCC family thiol-disulfide oxidoreductase YuxK
LRLGEDANVTARANKQGYLVPVLASLARAGGRSFAIIGRGWSQIWFQPSTTTPLEIVRVGVGSAVLFHYAMATPFLFIFWGDTDWMPREAALKYVDGPWMQSVFFYLSEPWQWVVFHALFLFCSAAFVVGWRTAWVKWIVLAGQISYDYGNLTLSYGAHSIAASLLFILCLAPVGRALSLDRARAVRIAKCSNLEATLPPYTSAWAGACTRLVQLQMVVLFLCSGIEKVRGDEWWSGDAIWLAFTTNEFYNAPLVWLLARQYWLVTVATYGTILLEVAYAFLIWQRRTRPYLLVAAVLLHVNFAVLLGLVYFSFIMIMGHLSFLRPEWLARLGEWWKRKIGALEMIYDGRCTFCVRSMAWLLAFDGLGQIKVRDFRTSPSPAVSDAQLEKALYLVLPDGRALPGFEAYRHVALHVPGLWWQVPFFYVPVLSRLVGRPTYDWVAANRSRISTLWSRASGVPWRARSKV